MMRLIPGFMFLVAFLPRPALADLPTKPAEVLPYLQTVYKNGDIEAYADLLTADFHFVMHENGAGWDKVSDVKGTRALFGAASPKLTFPKEISVKVGPQAGTWVIEDVALTLDVTQKKDGKVWHVENICSFLIRDEGGKIRIAEWRQKSPK